MSPIVWFLLGCCALLVLVILEGKRQERKYGRSGRGNMMRAGLLELQRHLEPERRVEILLEKPQQTSEDESGEDPRRLPL